MLMTKKQATEMFQAGKLVAVVEYRSSVVEHIAYRDKVTGRALSFDKITHNVELGALSIAVSERAPEGLDITKYVPPVKKGTVCLWHVDSYARQNGAYRGSGVLEALTD